MKRSSGLSTMSGGVRILGLLSFLCLPLMVAAIVMALGITFPPGGIHLFNRADEFWRTVGGPAWCMLGMFAVLIWTNAAFQREAATDLSA